MYSQMRLCCLPSTPDPDDKPFASVLQGFTPVSLVDEYCIPELTPVSSQVNTGTCVCNAGVDVYEMLHGLETGKESVQFSRLFPYWTCRLFTGDHAQDKGTFIRIFFGRIRDVGLCLEDTWPFNPWETITVQGVQVPRIYAPPGIDAFMEADSNKIVDAYNIMSYDADRVFEMETAIRANHPVVLSAALDSGFMQYNGEGVIQNPPANDASVVGLHAMAAVGVRTNSIGNKEFLLRNSWGMGWGRAGHVWIGDSFIKSGYVNDLWVATKRGPVVTW